MSGGGEWASHVEHYGNTFQGRVQRHGIFEFKAAMLKAERLGNRAQLVFVFGPARIGERPFSAAIRAQSLPVYPVAP